MTRRYAVAAVAVFSVLLSAIVYGPSLLVLGSHYLGIEYVDHYGTQWFYWFVEHTLRTGGSFAHTNLLFFPYGKDIYLHTGANVLDAILALPFRWVLGPVLGYNLFVLAGIGASAWAFTRLAREFTDDTFSIGLGALLFAFTPYVLFEAVEGRPTQAVLLAPVLYLLFLWRSGCRSGWRAPVLAGVMLAVCGYQYWYYAFFGGILAIAHGAWRFLRPPPESGGRWRVLARHGVVAAVSVGICLPVALKLILMTSQSSDVPGLLDTSQWSIWATPPKTSSQTFVGLFVWQPFRQAAGFFVQRVDGVEEFLEDISWTPLVLIPILLFWLWKPGKLHRGPVLAMLILGVLIAMGPIIVIGNKVLPNVFYVYVVKAVGFLQRLWWPGRCFAFLSILLGLMVVVVLDYTRRYKNALRVTVASVVVGAWSLELLAGPLAPYPTWDASIPAGYKCLASGPEGALIEIPYAWTQAHLYYQTVHGRPILGGMVEDNPAFTPDEIDRLRQTNTFVQRLLELPAVEGPGIRWTEADRKAVHDMGYRYVIVQKEAFITKSSHHSLRDNLKKARQRAIRKEMNRTLGRPVYEDQRVAIYAPWGDPAPCSTADVRPDLGDVEPKDKVLLNPGSANPAENALQRVIRPSTGRSEDTGIEVERVPMAPALVPPSSTSESPAQ